jgi:ABC-type nitrate/sulfonate/bicarbonate transport system permease component
VTSIAAGARPVPSIPAWVLGTGGVALLFLLFEVAPRVGLVDPRYLPPVSEMLAALANAVVTGTFWTAVGQTVLTWGIGLAISLVAGVVLGVLIGSSPFLRELTASTVEFLRPVPSVALIPVAVLLLGTGMQSTLLLVVYASFWQVLIQVLAGVQDVDPVASDTARSYRFSTLTRVRTVVWPTTLPYAMTGLRLAASVALILTVTGELLISFDGIGGLFETARQSGNVPIMYAYVIVTGILGLLVNVLARSAEKRMLFWHPSVRSEARS